MSLKGIRAGDYGQPLELTFIDEDTGEAADISGYTTIQQVILTPPSGSAVTKTAAFKTDGTDGIIRYIIEEGVINAGGNWEVYGRVKSGSAQLTTLKERFYVTS